MRQRHRGPGASRPGLVDQTQPVPTECSCRAAVGADLRSAGSRGSGSRHVPQGRGLVFWSCWSRFKSGKGGSSTSSLEIPPASSWIHLRNENACKHESTADQLYGSRLFTKEEEAGNGSMASNAMPYLAPVWVHGQMSSIPIFWAMKPPPPPDDRGHQEETFCFHSPSHDVVSCHTELVEGYT